MANSSYNQFTLHERAAIKSMKSDSNIYLPSDKGGEFTVIGKQKYIELGEEHLSNTAVYQHLIKDKTNSIRLKLNSIWRNICSERKFQMPMQLKLTTQTCRTQQFYHLLKTHKAGL